MEETLIVSPGKELGTVIDAAGGARTPPKGWRLLLPGDPGLTRRVKGAGPTWTVQVKKGRKVFSQGVWADGATIDRIEKELEVERATPAYAKRRQSDQARREREQQLYVEDFERAVCEFLAFNPLYLDLAARLASAVTLYATPVGSGTVARTERIPIEQRAESAVIAWMRHQTTAYDSMKIARVKGERREVRRLLATRSREILANYRSGKAINAEQCPLQVALQRLASEDASCAG